MDDTSDRTILLETRGSALSFPGTRLVVARGPDRGRSLELQTEQVVVGTSPSADLRLSDTTVSRNHFSLRITTDGCLVTDLESASGTFLAGRRILGAWAQLGESIELGQTRLHLEATRQRVELPLSGLDRFGELLGRSIAARRLFARLEELAREDNNVLILGEAGVGKEAVASAIHDASGRAGQPFIVIDCRTVVEEALAERAGAFRSAVGGTLFLDEVGALPLELQPRLLRAIDAREIRRAATDRRLTVAVRIIAATAHDLRLDVNRDLFREDLHHRLNDAVVTVAPLRDRTEDIPMLADRFWRACSGDEAGEAPPQLLGSLAGYRWPGNLRELRDRIEQAAGFPVPMSS